MNSEEIFLTIRIFYKEKSFDINSKDVITLKEIKEKSIKHFNINALYKNKVKFFVKDNNNDNDDKIYISSEDDIIKNSIEKDPQNLIIELQLTTDDIKGNKTKLLDKSIEKNNKSIIDNIKNEKEKNTFKIIRNDCICFEGNNNKINELNKEINKFKKNQVDYIQLNKEILKLKNDIENYKKEISRLKEENLKLEVKYKKSNLDFNLNDGKRAKYIKELEEKIKNLININIDNKKNLIKEEKVIELNIQNNLEKLSFNKQKLNLINNDIPYFMGETSSLILQNDGEPIYNNKDDLYQVISIDKEISQKQENLNANLSNINIEEFINNNNKNKFMSRNEEIKKEFDISNLNPKTEIKKIKVKNKNKFNFEEKKLDIDNINKIRKQCGDQVKNYSDEKIQRILDENGGNFQNTLVDIMLRFSKIINN